MHDRKPFRLIRIIETPPEPPADPQELRSRRCLAALSVALWLSSLWMPAFECSAGGLTVAGSDVLGMGWLGLLALDPRWYANLTAMALWYRLVRPKVMPPMGLPAVLTALAAISVAVALPRAGCPGPGTSEPPHAYAYGAYVWAASLLLAAAGAWMFSATPRRRESVPT